MVAQTKHGRIRQANRTLIAAQGREPYSANRTRMLAQRREYYEAKQELVLTYSRILRELLTQHKQEIPDSIVVQTLVM